LKEGVSKASLIAPTKKEAIEKSQNFLARKIASLKIHGEDGKIQ
jgi:hypothetical protein